MKQHNKLYTIPVLILIVAVSSIAVCASVQAKITGIYSDMYYNDEGGDIIGHELFIVYSRDNYYVFFQSSEGEPDMPQLVPARIEGSAIYFTLVSSDAKVIQFNGVITDDELTGKFDNSERLIILRRGKSYWQ